MYSAHTRTSIYTTAISLCTAIIACRTNFSTTTHSNNTAAACLYNFPSTATVSTLKSDLATELFG